MRGEWAWFAALVLMGTACWAAEPATRAAPAGIVVGPDTTVISGPLRGDGTVDYVAAINARDSAKVTPDNNAAAVLIRLVWPGAGVGVQEFALLRKALGVPEEKTPVEWRTARDFYDNKAKMDTGSGSEAQWTPWSEKEYPKIASWLKFNEAGLAVVVEASKRTMYWLPLVPVPYEGHPSAQLPADPQMEVRNEWGRALRMRAMLKVNEGDVGGAWEDLAAAHRWNRLLARGTEGLDVLVARTSEVQTCRADSALLASGKMTVNQLRAMAAEFAAFRLEPDFDAVYQRDEFETLDSIQLLAVTFEDALAKAGSASADTKAKMGAAGLYQPDWNRILKTAVRVNQDIRLVHDIRLTTAQSDAHRRAANDFLDRAEAVSNADSVPEGKQLWLLPKPGETEADYSDRVGYHVIGILTKTGSSIPAAVAQANDRREWMGVAVALAIYHLDHGDYPADLQKLLEGKYLERLPGALEGTQTTYEKRAAGCVLRQITQKQATVVVELK